MRRKPKSPPRLTRTKPSKADIDMTRDVRDAGKALGVTLHDHVIVGREGYASLKSLGLI